MRLKSKIRAFHFIVNEKCHKDKRMSQASNVYGFPTCIHHIRVLSEIMHSSSPKLQLSLISFSLL